MTHRLGVGRVWVGPSATGLQHSTLLCKAVDWVTSRLPATLWRRLAWPLAPSSSPHTSKGCRRTSTLCLHTAKHFRRRCKLQLCACCLTMKPRELLLQCTGSCTRIQKPQYCGKECQKAASSFLSSLACSASHGFFFSSFAGLEKTLKMV